MSNSADSTTRDDIAAVLGRTPSGLFILTAGNSAGDETGMLASWVQQAGFEPPTMTVAINRRRYINDWLAESPKLVLNLVGETQKQFLGHFGRGFEPGIPAFEGLNTARAANGVTALADALGWLEGTVTDTAEAGDHVVHVVEIIAASQGANLESEKPWVHIRKSGFGY